MAQARDGERTTDGVPHRNSNWRIVQKGVLLWADFTRPLLEARLWHRQPGNIRACSEHSALQFTVVAVIGCNRIEITHIRPTEGNAGYSFGRHFDPLVHSAIALESH